MAEIYDELKRKAIELMGETVRVKAKSLSVEAAIGNPEADDFPFQKGKERL